MTIATIIGNERNKFHLLREYGDGSKPPNCLCGCGNPVTWNNEIKNWNKRIYGHVWNTKVITLPQQPCFCGCGELTMPGKRYISGHNAGSLGLDYKKICPHCNKYKVNSIHHIYPRQFGGADVKENKIMLCKRCHDKIEILTCNLLSKKGYTIDILKSFILNCFPNEDILKGSRYYETY